MPIVHCPECRKATSVPDSDRVLSVQCPHCIHAFQLPASVPAAIILDEVELAKPASPVEEDAAEFDFLEPAGRGAAPVVSDPTARLRQQEARAAGSWLLFAAILDGVPIGMAGFWALLAGLESPVAENAEFGAFVALVFGAVALVLVMPTLLGAWSVAGGRSFGLSLTGAIFSILVGVFYSPLLLLAVVLVLGGQVCVGVVSLALGSIGVFSVIAGVVTIKTLVSQPRRSRSRESDERREQRRDERRWASRDEDY